MDTLSNGDIFLHDISMVSISKTVDAIVKGTPQNIVCGPTDIHMPPGYEPSIPVRRVAVKPEIKSRDGVMCPSCHQSRMLCYDVEKSDTSDEMHLALVFGFDEKTLYMIHPGQIIGVAIANLNGITSIDASWNPTEEEKLAIVKLLSMSDKMLMSMTEAVDFTIMDLAHEWDPVKRAKCPLCGEIHAIQTWINEYAFPRAGYHDICKLCGGEMAIDCKTGFMGNTSNQPMKCEVCGHEDTRNLNK